MGRGRAPCCDKDHVVRGPWSPAEDQKLLKFVQKYGHDNWRHLPRLAGLARCGKSARLRWVNYLSPDVKRGNFSKKEDETIIQLQQTLGNKWSKIVSHLPGRTDNEIKNHWNTHLKKRLTRRAAEVVNQKTAVITSSSSSSTTVDSISRCHKPEIESQLKLLVQEDSENKTDETGIKMMALAPSHQTIVANNVVPISQQSEKLLDSSGTDQLEKIIIWDDISLLESLLNEVDDSHWPPGPGNTQNEFTGNNLSCELLMECDFDFWSGLNNGVIPAPAKAHQIEADYAHNVESPVIDVSMISPPDEYTSDQDINGMYGHFQIYSGLPQQSAGVCGKQIQHQKNDVNNSFLAAATDKYVNQMSNMNDLPMSPQSPNYLL